MLNKSKKTRILGHIVLIYALTSMPVNATNSPHITYVPISVGDITVIIPIFNQDSNNNGVPDYDDPALAAGNLLPALCAALSLGSIDIAVRFISPVQRERYRRAFFDLGLEAAVVCSELTNVTLITSNSTVREWTARRMVNGELRAYILTEVIDTDGVFRLSEF